MESADQTRRIFGLKVAEYNYLAMSQAKAAIVSWLIAIVVLGFIRGTWIPAVILFVPGLLVAPFLVLVPVIIMASSNAVAWGGANGKVFWPDSTAVENRQKTPGVRFVLALFLIWSGRLLSFLLPIVTASLAFSWLDARF